ncbi:MAG: phosphoadenylyl-sulfate reductase [Deltaproteobacteria bacterium]|nr:phosphoadenylyl-sulfate reductase [Deltaproteobacteria bacterium]
MMDQKLIDDLEKITDPQKLIGEIYKRFGNRAAIGTSGQLTGVVMIDMAVQLGMKNPRIFTIDTLRLFPETYALFDMLEKKYKIKIERVTPDAGKIGEMVSEHGEYLFFDSKAKQERCCFLRKVEPNERALKTVDVWLTGLRRDQSVRRSETSRFEIIKHKEDGHAILKIAPLADWTEEQLKTYAQKNGVPIHPLLEWNQNGWYYESLGCIICTTPISPTEPRRAGRWRWFKFDSDKECGIHGGEHKDEV